ncbi:MAG: CPBP family intramembrane metalloprotease [Butyrivibrio sp.]|nr:CPBP family intramembrane metalloprotease [Butyrivibrio sp.]
MKTRSHKILDHPILGYFILFVFAIIFMNLGTTIDHMIARFIPGYSTELVTPAGTTTTAIGIGAAIGSLVAILIYMLWFKPDFQDILSGKGFVKALLMMLPALLIHYVGSAVSMITLGTSSVFLALLKATAPGFGEEAMFRILGVSNYMRTTKSEKKIMTIFWLSSIFFGLFHLTNILSGADIAAALVQAVYAIGIGMILGAVYLRTANAWAVILAHMSLDFLEFCRGDLGSTGGIMTGMGIGDWITVAAAIVAAVLALRLVSKDNRPAIMELWNKKWNKEESV